MPQPEPKVEELYYNIPMMSGFVTRESADRKVNAMTNGQLKLTFENYKLVKAEVL